MFSAGTIGLLSVLITFLLISEYNESLELSRVIEDNDYVRGGLLPPDQGILEFGDGLDLEDDMGKKSKYYEGLENLFVGYDNIIIIEHEREHDKERVSLEEFERYKQPPHTYIFMTKEPFEYETLTGEFYYTMQGIRIISSPKGDINEINIGDPKNEDDVYVSISDGLIGIGREKFRAQNMGEEWFDLPTTLAFIDNENNVSIKGFITMEQAVELAKVLRR